MRWLIQNVRRRAGFAIKNPSYALRAMLRELTFADEKFIHDSLHTYDHMTWEFETAYPHLLSGGLLFSDDALWNDSFDDFARRMLMPAKILRGVGFPKKNS